MITPDHYFVITGCREVGEYSIAEVIGKVTTQYIHKISDNKKDGLKEARQWIGKYIKIKYTYSGDLSLPHYCVKPGRKHNEWNHWKTSDYYNLLKV